MEVEIDTESLESGSEANTEGMILGVQNTVQLMTGFKKCGPKSIR